MSNSAPQGNGGGGRRPGGVPNRHQIFDSNGPEIRIRGTAWQVYEKYLALARDAQASGDRVMAENYLQHGEHYYRIILAISEATGSEAFPQQGQNRGRNGEGDNGDQQNNAPEAENNNGHAGNSAPTNLAGAEQPSDDGLAAMQPNAAA